MINIIGNTNYVDLVAGDKGGILRLRRANSFREASFGRAIGIDNVQYQIPGVALNPAENSAYQPE